MNDEKSWGSLIINNTATIFSLLHKENKGEGEWPCELYSVDYFPINLIHQNAELLNMALVCRAFFKSFSSFINDHLTFRCMKDDSFQHYQPKLIKVAPSSNISLIPTSATFIEFFSCSRTIQLHSFPSLSPSLSSLTIDLSSYSGPLSFPSSLTYLNITTKESFFDLPPNLIELKFHNNNMDIIDFSKWKFSPSLSHLTIKCGEFISFTSLPTSLSHLSVNSFRSEDQYTWLPPSLIYLNIDIHFFNGNLPIPSFPSSLQYLFISCSGETITQQLPPLPKSIKTLSLPPLSHPLQSYPPNLIHLSEKNFYDNLPPFPNLQSLCLSFFMEQEQMFPSSLKSFRGKAAWMMSNLSPSSSLSHLTVMDPDTSFQIPNSITHLTLHFANYIPPLPPNIIDLKLFYISPLSSLPSSFPEGLQHISIMSHDHLDNDIILSFPSSLLSLQLPICKCILHPLPPNLQILSLGFYKGQPFPIKLFPESLRTLNIYSYEENENQERQEEEGQEEEKQEEEKQKEERQEIQELIQLPKGLMNLQCDIAWLEANQIVPPVTCQDFRSCCRRMLKRKN